MLPYAGKLHKGYNHDENKYTEIDMLNLFRRVTKENIRDFLREIGLYKQYNKLFSTLRNIFQKEKNNFHQYV